MAAEKVLRHAQSLSYWLVLLSDLCFSWLTVSQREGKGKDKHHVGFCRLVQQF